jgi:flagella basal body P-ring formation protein FlgA
MNELRTYLGYSLLSIMFIVASWTAPLHGAEIQLRSDATITGPVIRLGDVATIAGIDAAAAKQLAATELLPIASLGDARSMKQREVQDLLALRGVSLGDHNFAGASVVRLNYEATAAPHKTTIRPAGGAARGATLAVQTAIEKYLATTVDGGQSWRVSLELTDDQIRRAGVAFGRLKVSGGAEPWYGSQQFTVTIGAGEDSFRVAADVRLPDMIVVARRPLTKGDILRTTDLALEPMKKNAVRKAVFQSPEELVGMEAVRPIAEGQVLDANYVQPRVLVRRGEVVTVYAHAAGVRVKTTARARQAGAQGELIEVEALADRHRYFARVADIQIVEVMAAGTRADSLSERSTAR